MHIKKEYIKYNIKLNYSDKLHIYIATITQFNHIMSYGRTEEEALEYIYENIDMQISVDLYKFIYKILGHHGDPPDPDDFDETI